MRVYLSQIPEVLRERAATAPTPTAEILREQVPVLPTVTVVTPAEAKQLRTRAEQFAEEVAAATGPSWSPWWLAGIGGAVFLLAFAGRRRR